MKKLLKKILEKKLRFSAEKILKKYRPDIIGITGSVGKTSTKEAVFQVLKKSYRVRMGEKNYNNEIGVPLTIIGAESGNSSIVGWLKVFQTARKLMRGKSEYPQIIILELGADRPGDIEYLVSFLKCKIGIITALGSAHMEFFQSQNGILKEKRKLVESLSSDGYALLNADNPEIANMRKHTQAHVVTYGFSEQAEIRASEPRVTGENHRLKTIFKLKYNQNVIPLSLQEALGEHFIYCALAGVAVGRIYGIPVLDILQSLQEFRPPRGRMRIIPGIKNTTIIDDTYNASPEAVEAALRTMRGLGAARRIVVLGDMLELGRVSEKEHVRMGEAVAQSGADVFITVGERSRDMARGAKSAGKDESTIFSFSGAEEAGKFLQERIRPNDYILVKGSQGMRMEKIVKEIMAEPQKAHELLVRQDKEWLL